MLHRKLFEKKYVFKGKFEGFPFSNPLKGYAVSADFFEAAVDESITLVYMTATWAEIEPEEEKFSLKALFEKFHVKEYVKLGKRVVFRLMCDVPKPMGAMDIPEWLYRQTLDGYWYNGAYGSGYSPNYNNPVFIKKHERLLKAINEAFSNYMNGEFLAYVELGTVGHWGEWHTDPNAVGDEIGDENNLLTITKQYVEQFPKARLLMRGPFEGVRKYDLGLYNDMTGAAVDTNVWLGWIKVGGNYNGHELYSVDDFGQRTLTGGEFTSGLSWDCLLGTDFEATKRMIESSHQTFLGPKCPHSIEARGYMKAAGEISSILGYNIYIKEALAFKSILSKQWRIKVDIRNLGIAAFQFDWPLVLYIYNMNGKRIHRVILADSIKGITGTHIIRRNLHRDGTNLKTAFGRMEIAIEDPVTKKPAVAFCNNKKTRVTIWEF